MDFDDLYQEMLVQIWQSLKNFKEDSKLSTWIYRVCLNTAMSYNRKESKRKAMGNSDFDSMHLLKDSMKEDLADKQQSENRIELLYRCINQLKKDDRAIILLYLEKKKYDEIAEIIGLNASHIGVKISRIKKQLEKLLIEQDYARI